MSDKTSQAKVLLQGAQYDGQVFFGRSLDLHCVSISHENGRWATIFTHTKNQAEAVVTLAQKVEELESLSIEELAKASVKTLVVRYEQSQHDLRVMTARALAAERELRCETVVVGIEDDRLIAELRGSASRCAVAEALARLLERDLHPEDKPLPWIDAEKRMPHPGDPGRPGYLATVEIRDAMGNEGTAEARWEFGDPKLVSFQVVEWSGGGAITHWRWARV